MSRRKLKTDSSSPSSLVVPNKLKELEEHLYFRDVVKNSLIPFMKAKTEAKNEKREFFPNVQQQYDIDVFYNSYRLFEAVKRLYDIPCFTNKNPSFKSLTNSGVTPEDWFVYHYANFRLVATGIYDTALIVTNFLLMINLPVRECRDKKIRFHPEVAEKHLDVPLIKLKTLLEKYREERNSYLHRSERPDLDFVDNLKAYRFLKEAKEKGLYKGKLPDPALEHRYFLEERDKKCTEMRKEADEICSCVLELLVSWHPVYLKMINTFLEHNN